MKRIALLLGLILLAATTLSAWAPGTHVYIANKVKATGVYKADVLYGATAPDLNLLFSTAPDDPTFFATHYGGMAMWQAAMTNDEKALAFGFMTHNEAWGADHFAHIASHVYPTAGQGYVIIKADQLCQVLTADLTNAGMSQYTPIVTPMNCHFILEYGLDLLAKHRDPYLGEKVTEAALHRSPEMAALLAKAYAGGDPYVAGGFAQAEAVWRQTMIAYGQILKQPDAKALPAMAEFLANLALQLKVVDESVPHDALVMLLQLALTESMRVCATDFYPEIDATVYDLQNNPALAALPYRP
jgi:hypothetical protein